MTHLTSQSPRRAARMRRFVVGVAVAGATIVVGDVDPVAASPRTTSEVIAAEADRALDALERWNRTQNPTDYVRYVQTRELTATMTAFDLEIDPAAMRAEWSAAPTEKQHAVLAAISQLGVPYRNLKSDPDVGFDCSGLTIWAYDQAGVEIPRVSSDQIAAAEDIELASADPGDLVYYPGHIGMYLGAGGYIHSPNSGNHVEAAHLPSKSLRFGDALAGD